MVGFAKNSDTSLAAARAVRHRASGLRDQVLDAIKILGNATCDEIENLLDMTHQTASARVHELAAKGTIHDTGRRRPTRSGRNAAVYAFSGACAKAA